ncbi:ESX-1 secretion system protein EccE1 [Mycobacterium tuberculosis]|nr:ESX-1 secretion system protein EccE1 [Mycobacterium tuberculosis]
MRNPLGLRFSTGHALLASALAPPCIIAFLETRYWWAGIALASLGVIVATVTFYGRRITGWVARCTRGCGGADGPRIPRQNLWSGPP